MSLGALARQENGRWWTLWGTLSWSASPHPVRTSFFAPDFARQSRQPWLVAPLAEELSSAELAERLNGDDFALSDWQEPNEEAFLSRHQEVLQQIERGNFRKVVPAVFSHGRFQGNFPVRPLLEVASPLWPYGFALNGEGMIGATPEILFSKTGRLVRTQAVAGTAACDGESLLNNPKERLEHKLVVEDISGELFACGEVNVGETTERPAGPVKHLVTPITLKLKQDVPFEQLVNKLHPTAALGGYPRAAAQAWLKAQPEFSERRRFGAPFGWRTGNGDGVCLVAIRNLQWQNSQAWIGSGCGVVAGSVGSSEWQELRMKRSAILQTLGVQL